MDTPRSARTPRRRTRGALAATAIAAVIGATLSATSAAAALAPADDGAWRFDFGTATSPVADGYQQVTTTSLYTAEAGWGVTVPDGVTLFDRNRTGNRTPADPVAEDFVAGTDWGFLLDSIPAGEYDVTVSIGDALTTTSSTNATVTLEGVAQTRLTTTKGGTTTQTFRTKVEDGQLTVGFTGSGLGAYVNGLVVAPVVPAVPAGLAVDRVAWNGVDLSWNAADGAAAYRVLRAPVADEEIGEYVQVAEGDTTAYSDSDVTPGAEYAYTVEAVNSYGLVSARAAAVHSGVIPELTAPATPTGVTVAQITKDAVALTWAATPNAEEYLVERAGADGDFASIATVQTPGFTDQVDTSAVWTYRVTAKNAAGQSAASAAVASTVYTAPAPLPAGDTVTFDFGPGALAQGAIAVTSSTAFSEEWGYGFSTAPTSADPDVDRGGDDPLRGDYVAAQGGTFEVQLGAGDYTVSLIAGDRTAASEIAITSEDIAKVQTTAKAAGEYLEMTFPIALVDGRLTFAVAGSAAALDAITITRQPTRAAGTLPTVYIAGDSTVQTYDASAYAPQAGWGQMIDRFFADDVAFSNHAIGGRSSKNFITQGRLDDILRGIRPGDYLFVQFGHNDATQGVDDRYASPADYKEYLRTYVNGARQRGATPVLVTPVSRRSFDAETGLANVSFPEYVDKMKELAAEEGVELVDLSASSRAYLDEIGAEAAKSVFLWVDPGIFPNRPAGTQDDTHFQEYGAIQMARLIAQDYAQIDDPLAAKVTDIEPPAEAPPAPTGLVAGSISNAGAVLQWQASATADIYRIERQATADPEQTWALVTTTTQTSSIVQGLAEGTGYRYRVFAVNGRGTSDASNVVTFTTKQAKWKFDFQLAGNPVMAGYTEVNPDDAYSAETGFGFETALDANAGRDRGASDASDLERDFVLPGDSSTFLLDVPNGTYSVKTYSGDWIGSTKTSFDIEGKAFGAGNAGKGSVNASVRGPVLVTDGQLTIRVYGAAAGTRLNGIEVTPILLGPAGLEVTDIDADPTAPTVALAWTAEEGLTWNVYRSSAFDEKAVEVGQSTTASFTDATARVGLDYTYYVTAVDQTGLESVPSASVDVSFTDPAVEKPSAPTGLAVDRLEKREVEISWSQPSTALYSLVFRSEKAGERGELVGFAGGNRFVDTGVLTTIPYHYTVVGVNAGGVGEASEQLTTDATTVLQRQAEYLDRAPVAVQTDDGALVSWRMLGTDPDAIAFHVYRDGKRITQEPITDSTNYLDESGDADSTYFVTSVLDGAEVTVTGEFSVQDGDYLSVPLDRPADAYTKDGQPYSYRANDTSVGDVDGDGQYELLVKWDPTNSKDNSQAGYTGNVYLDAYRLDGTRLWRIDLGVNIRAGAHYTQFQVFDYDGDGRAEVVMKTGDGTIDGTGQVIGNASADYRNSTGYVLTGPEYLTVFEGSTGRAIDTVDYIPGRGDVGAWGDTYGNRVDRFGAMTAYLDGEHPSVIFQRGYYTRTVAAAWDFDGEKLVQRWVFDTDDAGNEAYASNGNHNVSVADVDGDQKDELIFGSMVLDDDGTGLYTTGLGHGDAQVLGDLDPSRDGLEFFGVHEDMGNSGNLGATFRDAATGEVLWSIPATKDTGRGTAGDIDPRYEGAEGWAVGGDAEWDSPVGQLKSAKGELISENIPAANFLAWFDGDPLREIVDHDWNADTSTGVPTIAKWNWETEQSDLILKADGAQSNNGTKGTPNLQADLFGDWREEIAWRSDDSSELRIYSTSDETSIRLRTLMHDPVYRLSVAWQNTGYNQPPQTSFFLGDGFTPPAAPRIAVTGDPTGAVDTTPPVLSGVPADGTLLSSRSTYTVGVTADDPESGVRTLDIAFDGEPVAAAQVIGLDDLVGPHTLTVNAVNHDGLVTRAETQLLVFDDEGAADKPGRGSLSTNAGWEDGLYDGEYTVSMNLWYGVNGAVFRLYENGELVSTKLLDANSPQAQITTFPVSGKPNGAYVYTGELINAAGVTATTSVTVNVKDAAPGVPVLSHDNWDGDGAYTLTTNLWWGTNGTSYRLLENGVPIDEQELTAASPNAQQAKTSVSGRAPGTYIYVAELANAAGATQSKAVSVTVR